MSFPTLFISHGAPDLLLGDSPTRAFLSGLGRRLGRPRAVVVFSAHWLTPSPRIGACRTPQTIHDFFGFPEALYRLQYPAPGDPALARRIVERLTAAGLQAETDAERGLDHGVWVPLMLMYPQADIPVVPVSLQPALGPAHHLRLGEALAGLSEEGVLILGSGGLTHNLRELRPEDEAPPEWVSAFTEWVAGRLAANDRPALLDYRRLAPQAARNHPTEEHLLPLFSALGAAGPQTRARRLHAAYSYGALAMDAYAFEAPA